MFMREAYNDGLKDAVKMMQQNIDRGMSTEDAFEVLQLTVKSVTMPPEVTTDERPRI